MRVADVEFLMEGVEHRAVALRLVHEERGLAPRREAVLKREVVDAEIVERLPLVRDGHHGAARRERAAGGEEIGDREARDGLYGEVAVVAAGESEL